MHTSFTWRLEPSFFVVMFLFVHAASTTDTHHYNIPDPECTGPFGLCTQQDKDRLGYQAIVKLHEKMDDDRDGHVELQETKEFMKEELQYKGSSYSEREQKFHNNDYHISVDEMWKSWKHSQVHNWTTDDVVNWLNDQVKLPQYVDNFRRNRIDGQFLPRLAVNENNYYSVVMQIKDARHKRQMMIKATDLVLFGQQQKPHNLIKDILMISALTMSIFVCIYLFSKHRQSLDQLKKMMIEFDKLATDENMPNRVHLLNSTTRNHHHHHFSKDISNIHEETGAGSGVDDEPAVSTSLSNNRYTSSIFNFRNTKSNSLNDQQKENSIMTQKNQKLVRELNLAKQEAETLRKARENADGQLMQLKLAEQELEKVRVALKQTETRLEMVKYQPPASLIHLLNRTYESEKELLEFKFKLIHKEKESCLDTLNKVSKRQSGILGALKIAHSSTLEELNHKLELLKREIEKCKTEKSEWSKRWNSIDEICNRSDLVHSNGADSGSHDLPFLSLDNGLILPRRIWPRYSSIDLSSSTNSAHVGHQQSLLLKNSITNANINLITSNTTTTSAAAAAAAATVAPPNPCTTNNCGSHNADNVFKQAYYMISGGSSQDDVSNSNNHAPPANKYFAVGNLVSSSVEATATALSSPPATSLAKSNLNSTASQQHIQSTSSLAITENSSKQFNPTEPKPPEISDISAKPPVEVISASSNATTSSSSADSSKISSNSESHESSKMAASADQQQANGSPKLNINIAAITTSVTNGVSPVHTPNGIQLTPITITTTSFPQKIARESFIHKNDVFQFDDVESLRTNDIMFRHTPPSSFESDDTYRSSSQSASEAQKSFGFSTLPKKSQNSSQAKTTTTTNGSSSDKKQRSLRPLSNLFPSSTSSSTKSKKKKQQQQQQPCNDTASVQLAAGEELSTLKRSNTLTTHLNQLRKLFTTKNQSSSSQNFATTTAKLPEAPAQQLSIQNLDDLSKPIMLNSVNSTQYFRPGGIYGTGSKQLTIKVNSGGALPPEETGQATANQSTFMKNEVISIPISLNSTPSFTIKSNRSLENVNEEETLTTVPSDGRRVSKEDVNNTNSPSKLSKKSGSTKKRIFKFNLNSKQST